MSTQRRPTIAIALVLLVSLCAGVALTYVHVLAEVQAEMEATLATGARRAANAVADAEAGVDPLKQLQRVVRDFDGDDRLALVLRNASGARLARSNPRVPDAVAPAFFQSLVGAKPARVEVPLPPRLQAVGSLALEQDPTGAVAEAWDDARLGLSVMAVVAGGMLALLVLVVRRALTPARADGSDDEMNAQLSELRRRNLVLEDQIVDVRGAERAELARDLHDDVAPFLFGIGADAALVSHYLETGAMGEAMPRARAITETVHNMQHHIKTVLHRLAQDERGLAGALQDLTAFWKRRMPKCEIALRISEPSPAPPLDRIVFRVVQEALSNAMRHGAPTLVEVSIDATGGEARVAVSDDGVGFPAGSPVPGFGLTGMRDRVRAAGGTVTIGNRTSGHGAIVEVLLPLIGPGDTAAGSAAHDRRSVDAAA